ncbi:MAG TPA: glycosyltransferase family 4 protein [Candidatus Paceibacterota bacterium]|nr:glycosyltransferase family 4 protein [Candidatus Paceibacterota bacterium]
MDQKRRRKILFVITKSNFGGAQRYVFELATELHQQKSEEFEICVAFGGSGLLKEKLGVAGIGTIEIKGLERDIGIFKDLKAFFSLLSILRKERPDIIHLNSSKAGLLGVLAGRIARIQKIVFTGHGWAFNQKRSWIMSTILKACYVVIISLCHKVIAVSQKTKEDVLQLPFINEQKIIVIHNGIPQQELLSKETAREKLLSHTPGHVPTSPETLWIGTLAELHPRKGLDILINSLTNVSRPFHAWIIGAGESKDSLIELATTTRLQDKVSFTGFISNASALLPAFDIFILPSRDEALPYVLLEAGAASLPTIATAIAGVPEIIEHNKTGILIPPENIGELTRAIDALCTNPERSQFGMNLRTTILERFSLTGMVERTIKDAY